MKKWDERPTEVAYLLNPAFCGRLLYHTIKTYNVETQKAFPFPLLYLILPLLLHKHTRQSIDSRKKFLGWVQASEYLLIRFAERTKQLVPITNEAFEMLMHGGRIMINEQGNLEVTPLNKTISANRFTDDEIKNCINKSSHIAKWFAKAGNVETIYIALGVRP